MVKRNRVLGSSFRARSRNSRASDDLWRECLTSASLLQMTQLLLLMSSDWDGVSSDRAPEAVTRPERGRRSLSLTPGPVPSPQPLQVNQGTLPLLSRG